jgi:hypothetical protein
VILVIMGDTFWTLVVLTLFIIQSTYLVEIYLRTLRSHIGGLTAIALAVLRAVFLAHSGLVVLVLIEFIDALILKAIVNLIYNHCLIRSNLNSFAGLGSQLLLSNQDPVKIHKDSQGKIYNPTLGLHTKI